MMSKFCYGAAVLTIILGPTVGAQGSISYRPVISKDRDNMISIYTEDAIAHCNNKALTMEVLVSNNDIGSHEPSGISEQKSHFSAIATQKLADYAPKRKKPDHYANVILLDRDEVGFITYRTYSSGELYITNLVTRPKLTNEQKSEVLLSALRMLTKKHSQHTTFRVLVRRNSDDNLRYVKHGFLQVAANLDDKEDLRLYTPYEKNVSAKL